jgi:hypothetical protein
VELAEIELPAYELDTSQPSVPASTFQARLAAAEGAAAGAGLDALVVYADREHFANMSYLTGFDPRFEEALLILVPGRLPALLVGNEDEAYAAIVPYAVDVVRYQSFSLVNQDRIRPARRHPAGGRSWLRRWPWLRRRSWLPRWRRPWLRRRDPAGDRGLEVLRPGRGGPAGRLDRGSVVHRGRAAVARLPSGERIRAVHRARARAAPDQ